MFLYVIHSMKRFFLFLSILMSAISADAQQLVEKPGFFDNWSVSLAGGVYHPMLFDLKYLVDCSGWAGSVGVRKQLTPIVGVGAEANGYYRMNRDERKDPRTVIGPVVHINLMNLFGGYKGTPRLFEIEANVMTGWGHLYRGTNSRFFPDENYFATKCGIDFNFNFGKTKAWTVSLKPAVVNDMRAPKEQRYNSFSLDHTDLQLFVGCTYHFCNSNGKRHLSYAEPQINNDEINRLTEVVNYLRSDVEGRDKTIEGLKHEIEGLQLLLKERNSDK